MGAKAKARASGAGAGVPTLNFERGLFRPGQRVCVAVSGGADSTALLRALTAARAELGLVLSVLHVHHGIRGAEADADAVFVAALAAQLDLPCEIARVDAPAHATAERASLETAARTLRYAVFRRVLGTKQADALATAHTLDDQAETVLMKLLRGAWTEGLSGIHPVFVEKGKGREVPGHIVRPLLGVRRAEIEAYLRALGQGWCEDLSNRDPVHTRNRVRHDLLPVLRAYNTNLDEQLARMATLARDEETYWQGEMARMLPSLLLPGRPVRGGGRSVSTAPGGASLAIEAQRLLAYAPAVRRRVLRAAAAQLGATLDFEHTEALLDLLARPASAAGRKLPLANGLLAERSARELRLERRAEDDLSAEDLPAYTLPVPGEVEAVVYGLRLRAIVGGVVGPPAASSFPAAMVRAWRPGDRATLLHTRGPKKVKEVLERMHLHGKERQSWPVVVWQGRVVWMQGASVVSGPEAGPQVTIEASPL
jgi:tRNA(Ile)-lysidine synthase